MLGQSAYAGHLRGERMLAHGVRHAVYHGDEGNVQEGVIAVVPGWLVCSARAPCILTSLAEQEMERRLLHSPSSPRSPSPLQTALSSRNQKAHESVRVISHSNNNTVPIKR